MAITSRAQLDAALARGRQLLYNKTQGIFTGFGYVSHWLRNGTPQGTVPVSPAVCDATLAGALPLTWPTDGRSMYLAQIHAKSSNAIGLGPLMGLHDRLAHVGGLSSSSAAGVQTVGVDVSGTTSNLAARRGRADFGDVEWWVEAATNITGTASITLTYTDAAGGSGKTHSLVLPSAPTLGVVAAILPANGDAIQSIQGFEVTSASITGTFSIFASRRITSGLPDHASARPRDPHPYSVSGWADLCLPKIEDQACLFGVTGLSGNTPSFTMLCTFVEE